jgi:hypothetical protein
VTIAAKWPDKAPMTIKIRPIDFLCVNLGRSLEDKPGLLPEYCAPETFVKSATYARNNKLGTLYSRLLQRAGIAPPADEASAADAVSIAHGNAYVLHIICLTSDILTTAGIEHVFFKGPLQQHKLYGDFFAKPAADADVLVKTEHFERASEVLTQNGFVLPKGFDGVWWRVCLGERPLFRGDYGRPSLDLHHRLQQPGCPPPRLLHRFLDRATSIKLGSNDIPTADLPAIALISAINLVKAVYHREACGNHAFDLATAFRRMSQDDFVSLRHEAKLQGLVWTLAFASRAAALTFEIMDLLNPEPVRMPVNADIVRGLIISPESHLADFPKRRDMLFYLCDQKLPQFPLELARLIFSETARIAKC